MTPMTKDARAGMSTTPRIANPTPNATPPAAAAAAAAVDPLLAEPTGMPQVPLDADELPPPPLRPPMLDVSPVAQRMENLDAMRILCMLVIILTHVTEPYLGKTYHREGHYGGLLTSVVLSLNVMGRFGVPCFMMISFFIYWHQLYEKGRSWGELLARRFKRLIPAFVVWSAVYFLIHRQLYRHYGNNEFYTQVNAFGYRVADWRTWLHVFVYGQAEYHLYYLPLVMQCLLLIPLLRILWRKPAVAWGWMIGTTLAWAFVVYGPVAFAAGSTPAALSHKLFNVMNQPWAVPFLIFPLFGMMCAGQRPFRQFVAHRSDSFWWGLLILGLALHAAEAIGLAHWLSHGTEYELRVAVLVKTGRILSGCAVFCLFLRKPLMRDPFPRVSHYAFGLHFMHPAIITLLTLIELKLFPGVAQWQTHVIAGLTINLVLTFGITFCLCLLIGRFKKLEFLVV
jgi:peptidoglycan/LPS O-acetylase OafA/YrhL